MDVWLLVPIALPVICGAVLLVSAFREQAVSDAGDSGTGAERENRVSAGLCAYVGAVLGISVALALAAAWTGDREAVLFTLLDAIPVYFRIDAVGRLFVTVVSVIWVLAALFAFVYMRHEGKEKRYFGFYLMLYGVLVAFDFSGNLVTMYLFYELTTLVSMPLVLHNGKRESVMAALKYLFYSLCGAYGGLFAIFFLYRYSHSLTFTAGGTLDMAAVQGHEGILLIAVFAALLGFGAKAGMAPLHAWLPTAHPVAPSPASAVLSGVIVKSGVLAVVRVVFYIVGADFLRGTWVQQTWMALALLTVFMGSMLAYRERGFKKRLAYSTVSQVSYIMFGLSLLTADGFTGAMLHVAVHAVVKCGLFLTAGVFVYYFNYTRVEELVGIGKRMPKMLWCYLLLSLALVGIPPTGGFVSKWYLAQGALQSDMGVFAWLGPVVLLVSALLTAGYLLPVAMKGFFPGDAAAADSGAGNHGAETVAVPAANGGAATVRSEKADDGTEVSREREMSGGAVSSAVGTTQREKVPMVVGTAQGEKASTVVGTAQREKVPMVVGTAQGEKASTVVGTAQREKVPTAMGTAQREKVSAAMGAGRRKEPAFAMLLPLVILAALAVLAGVFPGALIQYASEIAASVL